MKLAHNHILIVMLMLVAFIGQTAVSTALSFSAAPCDHKSMNAGTSMMIHNIIANDGPNEVMSHASMMLSDSNQDSVMKCCQEQCKCPMNGCVSLSLCVDITRFNSLALSEQKISQLSSLHLLQMNTSLYRPPIS